MAKAIQSLRCSDLDIASEPHRTQWHQVVGLERERAIERDIFLAYSWRALTGCQKLRSNAVVIPLLVEHGSHVQQTATGQAELKLEASNHIALSRRKRGVLRVPVGTDVDRDVRERAEGERLAVREGVEADHAAKQAAMRNRGDFARKYALMK